MLLHKFLLTSERPTRCAFGAHAHSLCLRCGTGLIIFIKPETTTQLAAGFIISLVFFVWHVQTNAYRKDLEDELQFCAMLSITVTLYGGLVLKAQDGMSDEEDVSPAESALLAFILMAVNISVVGLCLYQMVLGIKKGGKTIQAYAA